ARRSREAFERMQRIAGAALDLQRRQSLRGDAARGFAFDNVRRRDFDARETLQYAVELVDRQEQIMRRKQRPFRIPAQQPVARFGVFPEALDRRRNFTVQADRRVRWKIVGDRRRRIEEQWQVVLDASRRNAVADVAIERRLRRIAFEHLAIAAAEARARRVVLGELARRQQAYARHGIERALGVDVEALDRFDFLVQ